MRNCSPGASIRALGRAGNCWIAQAISIAVSEPRGRSADQLMRVSNQHIVEPSSCSSAPKLCRHNGIYASSPAGGRSGQRRSAGHLRAVSRLSRARQSLSSASRWTKSRVYGRVRRVAGRYDITDTAHDLTDPTIELGGREPARPISADGWDPHWHRPRTRPEQRPIAKIAACATAAKGRLPHGIVKLVVDRSIQGFTARLRWPA